MGNIKMTQLVTLTEVKSYMDINSTTFDAKLTNLIVYASGLVESYCSRSFTAANVVYEYQDGGKPYVFANRIPINNIYSVAEYDGTQYVPLTLGPTDGGLPNVSANANAVPGFTWDSDSGKVWKGLSTVVSSDIVNTQAFNSYNKGIRLEYNGGYATIPDDLKLCCLALIKDLHKGLDDKIIRFDREQLEKMPYSGGFPPHIRRVLDLYRIVI